MEVNEQNKLLFTAQVNDGEEITITREIFESLDLVRVDDTHFHLLAGKKAYTFELLHADFQHKEFLLAVNGDEIRIKLRDRVDDLVHRMGFEMNGDAHVNELVAPMPGLVLQVKVKEGDEVKKGDTILILEAMKMENVLTAPADCKIESLLVNQGETVDKGQKLVTLS